MHPTRFVSIAPLALLMTIAPDAALGQAYPSKPVRLLVGFAPGGSTDVVARLVAEKLKDALGQQVIVENRTGAGGNIAADAVAKAPADGYTLLLGTTGVMAINDKLEAKLSYNAQKDFAPVIHLANLPLILVVPAALPVKSVKELVALAKARPGELNFASSGIGSSTHMSGELFKSMANINIVHVPYKGSTQMMADLIGGQITIAFDQITTSAQHVKSGKLRALGISTSKRTSLWPDMPTVAESGVPNYESISWTGIVVPAQTPRAIIDRLNAETAKVLQTSEMRDKFQVIGAEPVGGTPEQFAAHYRSEAEKWGRLLTQLGIKPQ